MSPSNAIKIGENFKPSINIKKLYYWYLLLLIIALIVPYEIPVLLFGNFIVRFLITLPTLALIIFVASWIPLYYNTIVYQLTQTEVLWYRGVWFRQTGIVPYNRITNIDILQGPLMRMLGLSSLRLQTAGYSGSQPRPELRLEGIMNPEELRDTIMGFVRGMKPVAVETYQEQRGDTALSTQIVTELQQIRKLLEKIAEK